MLYVPNNNFAYIDHKTITDLDHTYVKHQLYSTLPVFSMTKRDVDINRRDMPSVSHSVITIKCVCRAYTAEHCVSNSNTHANLFTFTYTGTGSNHTYTHTCANRHTGDRCLCCHCCFIHDTSEWSVRFASLSRCRCIVFCFIVVDSLRCCFLPIFFLFAFA